MANDLELSTIVLVFDQAIHAKAQTIRWQSEMLFKRTMIRLGEFHTAMTYLACPGKRLGESGSKISLLNLKYVHKAQ